MHPEGGNANQGTKLIFHTGCDYESTRMQFKKIDAGNGAFYLQNVETGRCVHPDGGNANQGTPLIFHTGCDYGARMQFKELQVEGPRPGEPLGVLHFVLAISLNKALQGPTKQKYSVYLYE